MSSGAIRHSSIRGSLGRIGAGLACAIFLGVALSSSAAGAVPAPRRIAGADRFETAALISEATFSPRVGLAYVVNSDSYADALAVVPVAARYGHPVLLISRDTVPAATARELERLRPYTIIAVGGTEAVGNGVMQDLAQYASNGSARVFGADRYETAAMVEGDAQVQVPGGPSFVPPVPVAFVTSGERFPDALSGGAAAIAMGAPLLLLAPTSIPTPTAQLLKGLRPQKIVVLGGPQAVSPTVEGQLRSFGAEVVRWDGADRYGTSAMVAASAFPSADTVYLAVGEVPSDALVAGSLVPGSPGPVLLVRRDCIPAPVEAQIRRLNPEQLVIIGGYGAVGPAVSAGQVCAGE
jgi:putative cell wall-binding protein